MGKLTDYFRTEELVCPHVFGRFKHRSLDFLDPRLKAVVLFIREGLGLPMYVNNWVWGGDKSQRGIRCNICALIKEKTYLEKVTMSGHALARALDFMVKGMTAQQVRDWLEQHKEELPYPIRVESGVSWVHIDVLEYGQSGDKITYFSE